MNKKYTISIVVIFIGILAVSFFAGSFVPYEDSVIAFRHVPGVTVTYVQLSSSTSFYRIFKESSPGDEEMITLDRDQSNLFQNSQLPSDTIHTFGTQKFGENMFFVFTQSGTGVIPVFKHYQEYVNGYVVTVSIPENEKIETVPFIDLSSIVIKP